LCEAGFEVVGIDNLNDYYDIGLKQARLQKLADFNHFHFQKLDLADREAMAELFAKGGFKRVIHLGAQAGVRYSIENPYAYADSNLIGTLTVLEGCRHHGIEHLVYASSSSVSRSSRIGCTVRTTKGRPIKTSAIRIPKGANATLIPSSPSMN